MLKGLRAQGPKRLVKGLGIGLRGLRLPARLLGLRLSA